MPTFRIHTVEKIEKWFTVEAEDEAAAYEQAAVEYDTLEDGTPEKYNLQIFVTGETNG